MNFIKKYFKIFVGAAVLVLVMVVFFLALKSNNLESGNLRHWRAASIEQRMATIKILVANEDNTEILVKCVDKIAEIPDSGELTVRDAASLCYTGIQLKENL